MRRSIQVFAVAALYALVPVGCHDKTDPKPGTMLPVAPKIIQGVVISGEPMLDDRPLAMNAARNETTSTVVQLSNLPKRDEKSVLTLRIPPLQLQTENAQIDAGQVKAYQILSMPVDANRAGYVRHTGQRASSRTMPRALLPVSMDKGTLNVSGLRDPSEPFNPNSRVGLSNEPVLLWFDLQVPATAKPGQYATTIEILKNGTEKVESIPLTLTVYDFVLPDERHLQMVGRIEWESLEALYPDLFETITPNLMSRKEAKYAESIKILDQLVALAHEHRTTVVVPRLQPSVKWPNNKPPSVDWTDFDALAEPWLSGSGFADKIPSGYWPLPRIDYLNQYPMPLEMQYWMDAASHFDQKGWMDRAWVEVEKETPGRATAGECIKLAMQATEILNAHPRLRVTLPVEDGQLPFRDADNPQLIDKQQTDRLMTAASGIVFAPAGRSWPGGAALPAHWLRTDLPGLVPYVGAGGDERDVRCWSWLAFLRMSQVIGWDGALPHSHSPQEAADPNELTWFYPGRWFGVDEPLPTIQLKWLRRGQQDYEYLLLAKQRGQFTNSLVMSRLMVKPVQTQLNEVPDPTHGLLTGTSDPQAWNKAVGLLAQYILMRPPGQERNSDKEAELNRETDEWIAPQDKPLQIARTSDWGWGISKRAGNWVDLNLGLDIYNASDSHPLTGQFQWVSAPRGWEIDPQPVEIPPTKEVNVFQIKRFSMLAKVDLNRLSAETRQPIQMKFIDSMRNRTEYLWVTMPVAACDRREGKLAIDGNLGDWSDNDDAIQLGPMVAMLDRPSVQRQKMELASSPTSLYANWADKSLYVAFKVGGISTGETKVETNQVDYQLRRAWGEDVCEVLIQPVYTGGETGQIVHLACKKAQSIVSIKPSPKDQKIFGGAYKTVVGSEVKYAASTEGQLWRGELQIPWNLINEKAHQGTHPKLIRFNFVQHKQSTGESASWAGPIDFGQDDSFMGLLFCRELKAPGMGQK